MFTDEVTVAPVFSTEVNNALLLSAEWKQSSNWFCCCMTPVMYMLIYFLCLLSSCGIKSAFQPNAVCEHSVRAPGARLALAPVIKLTSDISLQLHKHQQQSTVFCFITAVLFNMLTAVLSSSVSLSKPAYCYCTWTAFQKTETLARAFKLRLLKLPPSLRYF